MGFQLSPGVNVSEVDLTNVTPSVATTEGAIAGVFRWGPTNERILISSENELATRFGKPATYYTDATLTTTWTNHETWFSAANFLSYAGALYVTRVADATAATATATNFDAKYNGSMGNAISVSHCVTGNFNAVARAEQLAISPSSTTATITGYTVAAGLESYASVGDRIGLTGGQELVIGSITTAAASAGGVSVTVDGSDAAIVDIANDSIESVSHTFTQNQAVQYSRGTGAAIEGLVEASFYFVILVDVDNIQLASTIENSIAGVAVDLTAIGSGVDHTITPVTTWSSTVGFTSKFTGAVAHANSFTTQWGDANIFDAQPTVDGVHVVVRDTTGAISGTAGTVLERWDNVSTSPTATSFDGTTNFIVDVLLQNSSWIAVTPAKSILIGLTTFSSGVALTTGADGQDESDISVGDIAMGYDLYADASKVDVSFIIQGKARGTTLANYIIDNICEVRKDCVAFISPELADTTPADIVDFASTLSASTYAMVDSGYKYQYDKYSDVYRWIPLNGDIAGLCARTDDVRDPWFSPAGYSRGNVKNVVKLLVNPNQAQRDLLYKNNINPVITQPGKGTLLFGDKTFASTASAFDRINVRRLFIVLEKTIGLAAKSTLFEFNDEFTRAQFNNLVEPFLRDVQGRRGIYDFKVVCDETNNTAQVVDTNQFVGDIYVKPAKSINFIQLNFVAVRSGVEFSEIVGKF
jgi:hypothetical protein